jgi:putative hydrolase of HD superfamily
MTKPSHDDVVELLSKLILPFYAIERDMLVPPGRNGLERRENDAEHSWSVAVLACSLAPHIDESLDIGLVSQFAIVHDLVEVFASDVSVWADQTALDNKSANEAAALEKIQQRFSHFPWLVSTLEAYERQDSNEAKYVRAIDKYIALSIRFLDGGYFFRKEKISFSMFEETLQSHRAKAHSHPGVAEYYEKVRALYEQHPEHFFTD